MNKPTWLTLLTIAGSVCALPANLTAQSSSQPIGIFDGRTDIGEVVHPGVAVFDAAAQTYTLTAGGENMWSTRDAYYFLWKKMSGDVELSADIRFPSPSAQPHRKAVLVISRTLDADGVYADVAVHGSGLTALQYRPAKSAITQDIELNLDDVPRRVRIVKQGDRITMFLSIAGEPLQQTGASIALPFDGPFYIGIGLCSHDKVAIETAVFSHVEFGKPAPAIATGDRPAITSVSHLSVYTSDAVKAEHFYVHDLGATKGADPQDPHGVRFYFNPVQFVEVLPLPSGTDPKNRFDHAGYNVANAEQMRQYLATHKVDVPQAVTHGSDGSAYFEVKDPEGNRVQFVQPPAQPADVPLNPLSNHIIHIGYIVHNAALEDTFYRDLLGFRPYWHGGATDTASDWISSQVPEGHDWVEYMTVKGPEKTGIPPAMSKDTAGVLDHFALGMQNAEQSENLLYAGDRLGDKHSDPKIGRDGKWQINLYDPDGIRAELMEFQPAVKPCCSPFLAASPVK